MCPSLCRVCGRPQLSVSLDEVQYYRGLGFMWTKIAEMVGIGRANSTGKYCNISSSDLDHAVATIKAGAPK